MDYVLLTFTMTFHHTFQLLCKFCQLSTCPSRTRKAPDHRNQSQQIVVSNHSSSTQDFCIDDGEGFILESVLLAENVHVDFLEIDVGFAVFLAAAASVSEAMFVSHF